MRGKAGMYCRRLFEVEVSYLVVGGGGGQVITGSAIFQGGLPLTSIVAAGASDSSQLDTIVATGGGESPQYLPAGAFWLVGSGFRDNTNSPPNLVDGIYAPIPDSDFNGRLIYNNIENSNVQIKWFGSEWLLCAGGFGCLYKMGEGASPGGATNVLDFNNDPIAPPPPAFVAFPFPTGGGDDRGGIQLSYVDTAPELTISGMTFTTSTSGGRRQYTFTDGTGTIVFP